MIKNRMMKKLSAGFMAGLCAFSMLGSNLSSAISSKAASVSTTENAAFPSADEVIAQAATLLGSPYAFGCKGYTGIYYQDSYKPLDAESDLLYLGKYEVKETKAPYGYVQNAVSETVELPYPVRPQHEERKYVCKRAQIQGKELL